MKDREKVAVYNRAYYRKNKKRLLPILRARVKKWQKKNKNRRNANDRARRLRGPTPNRAAQRRYRQKLKLEALAAYGYVCSCCGESEPDFLTFDHINGGGTKHRKQIGNGGGSFVLWLKKHGYPKNYRILCFNCNWSAHLGNGRCCHERRRSKSWTDYSI